MKNAFVFALAIIGGSVVVIFVIGAILAANDTNTNYVRDDYEVQTDYLPPNNTAPNPKSDYVGATAEQGFMEGCMEYVDRATCQCMFNYLDQNLTNDEFWNLTEYPDPAATPVGERAINSCI